MMIGLISALFAGDLFPSASATSSSSSSSTSTPAALIDGYLYSGHAIDRMKEREIDSKDINWVISHGDRYKTLNGNQMIFHKDKNIRVFFEPNKNTVITVIADFDQKKLEKWLSNRDAQSTKEQKIAAAKKHERDIKHCHKKTFVSKYQKEMQKRKENAKK